MCAPDVDDGNRNQQQPKIQRQRGKDHRGASEALTLSAKKRPPGARHPEGLASDSLTSISSCDLICSHGRYRGLRLIGERTERTWAVLRCPGFMGWSSCLQLSWLNALAAFGCCCRIPGDRSTWPGSGLPGSYRLGGDGLPARDRDAMVPGAWPHSGPGRCRESLQQQRRMQGPPPATLRLPVSALRRIQTGISVPSMGGSWNVLDPFNARNQPGAQGNHQNPPGF